MCRMNDREKFLRHFKSVFTDIVERLETMTEGQVLDCLLEVKAARNIYKEEFSDRIDAMVQTQPRSLVGGEGARDVLGFLGSNQVFFNSVEKLRSQARAKARSGGSSHCFFDSLEDALNDRLEALRNGPGHDHDS
jgi:hypothetical protein